MNDRKIERKSLSSSILIKSSPMSRFGADGQSLLDNSLDISDDHHALLDNGSYKRSKTLNFMIKNQEDLKQREEHLKQECIIAEEKEEYERIHKPVVDMEKLTAIDQAMIGRKSKGSSAKSWLIYPDDKFANHWDLITTM